MVACLLLWLLDYQALSLRLDTSLMNRLKEFVLDKVACYITLFHISVWICRE